MYGQANLFSFKPRIKFFRTTPIELNQELWALIQKTDNRGYSFGTFNHYTIYKNGRECQVKHNKQCATVVLYKSKKAIGFCTISLIKHFNNTTAAATLDVWVMPYYRDMGFGSLLVNYANQKSLQLTGKLPSGSDKNHSHCWDARFRKGATEYNSYPNYYPDEQLSLFSSNVLQASRASTINRMLTTLSANTNLDYTFTQACVQEVRKVNNTFVVPNAR